MRRSVPVLIATAGGAALLAGFHTTATPTGVVTGAGPGTTAPAGPATTQPPASAGTGASATTSGSAATTTAAVRSVDGPVVDTRYGPVEVRVTLQGTRITDVQALVLPSDRSRSQRISDQAGPLLRSEALQAQSARIDVVSGASYTSEGYAQSLQGALDQAGA
jgi:uncharacterized protein with FMN-binding domain